MASSESEIKKRIEECSRGWQSHDEMGISVLCIFDYATMRYRVFDDHNAQEAVQGESRCLPLSGATLKLLFLRSRVYIVW